jgi:hypothetical protein
MTNKTKTARVHTNPCLAPISEVQTQKAIASGLKPTKVGLEVEADQEEVNPYTTRPENTVEDPIGTAKEEFEGFEEEDEWVDGTKRDPANTVDPEKPIDSLEEMARDSTYSTILSSFDSLDINPVLLVSINLTGGYDSNFSEVEENLEESLIAVDLNIENLFNYWMPFKKYGHESKVKPGLTAPLRQTIDYLSSLNSDKVILISTDSLTDTLSSSISSHIGKISKWKFYNANFKVSELDTPAIDLDESGFVEFEDLFNVVGYSSSQSDSGGPIEHNTVINISLHIPSLYSSKKPDVMSSKLVDMVDRMRGDLNTVVSFVFNSHEAVTSPENRIIIDSLIDSGFSPASRSLIESNLVVTPDSLCVLPKEISVNSGESVKHLFLHGGDLLLTKKL